MTTTATAKIIHDALIAAPLGPGIAESAEALAAALDAAGYVIRKKPAARKPAAPVEVFSPNTGDDALDAFMRRKHDAKWEAKLKKALASQRGMLRMPARAPGLPAVSALSDDDRQRAERDWQSLCENTAGQVATYPDKPSGVLVTLREVIDLHRSTWRQESPGVYVNSEHGYRIVNTSDHWRLVSPEGEHVRNTLRGTKDGDFYRFDDAAAKIPA